MTKLFSVVKKPNQVNIYDENSFYEVYKRVLLLSFLSKYGTKASFYMGRENSINPLLAYYTTTTTFGSRSVCLYETDQLLLVIRWTDTQWLLNFIIQ